VWDSLDWVWESECGTVRSGFGCVSVGQLGEGLRD
jgi:hypothetical protein